MTTASRYHPLRVRAVIDETHDTKSIVFEVPGSWRSSSAIGLASF